MHVLNQPRNVLRNHVYSGVVSIKIFLSVSHRYLTWCRDISDTCSCGMKSCECKNNDLNVFGNTYRVQPCEDVFDSGHK